jgi:hypothetical protein
MVVESTITIIGGLITIMVICVNKFKCYIHRTPSGKYDLIIGMLDRTLPIDESLTKEDNK